MNPPYQGRRSITFKTVYPCGACDRPIAIKQPGQISRQLPNKNIVTVRAGSYTPMINFEATAFSRNGAIRGFNQNP
jgi:hypothetical protein